MISLLTKLTQNDHYRVETHDNNEKKALKSCTLPYLLLYLHTQSLIVGDEELKARYKYDKDNSSEYGNHSPLAR